MVGKASAGMLRVKDKPGISKRSNRQRLLPLALKGVGQCDDQRLCMKLPVGMPSSSIAGRAMAPSISRRMSASLETGIVHRRKCQFDVRMSARGMS